MSLCASDLVTAGRDLVLPFIVELSDGRQLSVDRLFRVLPGKRLVGRACLDGRVVLAKLFIATASERHWQRELTGIVALAHAGIPTPTLLESSALAGGGRVLLTEFFSNAESLADLWLQIPADRSALMAEVMPLLASMHAAGLTQSDLHLGNFMRVSGQLLVIDGDAVTVRQPVRALKKDEIIQNLSILFGQLTSDWDVCWPSWLAAYSAQPSTPCLAAGEFLPTVEEVRRRRLADFLGKLGRDCTQFAVQRGFARFRAVDREALPSLEPLLAAPDAWINAARQLKSGATCTVAAGVSGDWSLVVKRYNLKNWRHALSRFWRASRAWNSWREAHRLRFLGIATPRPLAVLEERFGQLRRRAFLVTEYCPGMSLQELLDSREIPGKALADALLDLFSRLHVQRLSHGDLKASNLLWHEGRVVVIDLDSMRQHRADRSFRRAWRRDRARLLRNWPADSVLARWLDINLPA